MQLTIREAEKEKKMGIKYRFRKSRSQPIGCVQKFDRKAPEERFFL